MRTQADSSIEIDIHWDDKEAPTHKAILDLQTLARKMEEALAPRAEPALDSVRSLALADRAAPERPMLDRVPIFALKGNGLSSLSLSMEMRHLVSRVDGVSTLRELLCGMAIPTKEGVRAFGEMIRLGIVKLR